MYWWSNVRGGERTVQKKKGGSERRRKKNDDERVREIEGKGGKGFLFQRPDDG